MSATAAAPEGKLTNGPRPFALVTQGAEGWSKPFDRTDFHPILDVDAIADPVLSRIRKVSRKSDE